LVIAFLPRIVCIAAALIFFESNADRDAAANWQWMVRAHTAHFASREKTARGGAIGACLEMRAIGRQGKQTAGPSTD